MILANSSLLLLLIVINMLSLMGSGVSGLYHGTDGNSQPYADLYKVDKTMLKIDKKDPDIYDPKTGYFKNPTATNILEVKDNTIRVDGKTANGPLMYVLDKKDNIIIGERCNPNKQNKKSPHPTLIGGKDPKVQCAGMMTFRNGRIVSYNNNSGHFKPDKLSLEKMKKVLKKLYKKRPELFAKNFGKGKKHGKK